MAGARENNPAGHDASLDPLVHYARVALAEEKKKKQEEVEVDVILSAIPSLFDLISAAAASHFHSRSHSLADVEAEGGAALWCVNRDGNDKDGFSEAAICECGIFLAEMIGPDEFITVTMDGSEYECECECESESETVRVRVRVLPTHPLQLRFRLQTPTTTQCRTLNKIVD